MSNENKVLIWHPEVYRSQGQCLSISAVRSFLARPNKTLHQEILSSYEQFNAYFILGDIDMIIRGNIAREDMQQYQQSIEKRIVPGLDRVIWFEVQEPYYFWKQRVDMINFDLDSLGDFDPKTLLRIATGALMEEDKDLLESLKEKNLLLNYGSRSKFGCIQSFMLIDVEMAYVEHRIIRELIEIISEKVQNDLLIGLYAGYGIGFRGNVLLELGTNDTALVWGIARKLMNEIRIIQVKTESFIVGETIRDEIEICRFSKLMGSPESAWQPHFPSLKNLSTENMTKVIHYCNKWEKWFINSKTQEYFKDFINCMISDNVAEYQRLVLKLNSFLEKRLQEILISSSKRRWGDKEWKARSQQELNLGTPIWRAGVSSSSEGIMTWSSKFEETIFNTEYVAAIKKIGDMRNAIAHARVGSPYESTLPIERDLAGAFDAGLWQAIDFLS